MNKSVSGSGSQAGGIYTTSTGTSPTALSDFATSVDSVTGPGNFSKSCKNIYDTRAGQSGALFDNNSDSLRLNFSKTPADVFGANSPS